MKTRKAIALLLAAAAVTCTSTSALASRHCTEVSDIVGYERCHRFGDGWSLERAPPFVLSLQLPYDSFDPGKLDFSAARQKNDPNALSFGGKYLGTSALRTYGFGFRLEGFFLGPLYTGVSFALGWGSNSFSDVVGNGDAAKGVSLSPAGGANTMSYSVGAVLGVRVPLGRVSFRLEGVAGGSGVDLSQHSAIGDYTASANKWLLEPRAMVDVWISPKVTLSAYGGFNALDTEDRQFGLVLALHMRSYDGAFAFW